MVLELWEGGEDRVMDRFMGHMADLRGDDECKPAFHFIRRVEGKDDT